MQAESEELALAAIFQGGKHPEIQDQDWIQDWIQGCEFW